MLKSVFGGLVGWWLVQIQTVSKLLLVVVLVVLIGGAFLLVVVLQVLYVIDFDWGGGCLEHMAQ